jgi:ABC-type amino acid transport substrate-binding protein
MNRKIDNRILPMTRVFKELEYGRADFSIMLRTPFSEKIAVPVAYVGIPFKTIIWPRKGLDIQSYKDLKGVRLSMARGLKVGGEFSKQKDLRITPSQDYAHSMQMFNAFRVDAIVGTEQSLLYNAFKAGINPKKEFDAPFEVAHLEGWVQASSNFVEREGIKNLRNAVESLVQDGTFERIFKKYNTKISQSFAN